MSTAVEFLALLAVNFFGIPTALLSYWYWQDHFANRQGRIP